MRRRKRSSLIYIDRQDLQDTERFPVHPVYRCYSVFFLRICRSVRIENQFTPHINHDISESRTKNVQKPRCHK